VPNSWPSHVFLVAEDAFLGIGACAGTILNRHTVLTAGHCVPDFTLQITLFFAQHDLESPKHPVVRRVVDTIIKHENYKINEIEFAVFNDIALLKFDEPLVLSETIYPACLPENTLPENENPKAGEPLFAVGWGVTAIDNNFLSSILQNVLVSTIDDATCASIYNNPPGSFCAGDLNGGKGLCFGNY
jgi:secreted trypsin-like serine protease